MAERLGVKQFGRVGRIPTATGFGVGDINSYVILPEKGSSELVLIDTGIGSEDAWRTLGEGLNEWGFRVEDITLLLLTHAHTDHFGQAARIREAAGCEVWGHENINMTLNRYMPSAERRAPSARRSSGRFSPVWALPAISTTAPTPIALASRTSCDPARRIAC
ncbi:MAG: MBL fold metallo-hydrolase [Porticoccaceae bacterium]